MHQIAQIATVVKEIEMAFTPLTESKGTVCNQQKDGQYQ
jgi:hypothetical protein